jgi:hypothetical protein
LKIAKDKPKDDKLFNCSQEHELNYVASLYGTNKQEVLDFLEKSCNDGRIKNSTHKEVYKLIQAELGYAIPV